MGGDASRGGILPYGEGIPNRYEVPPSLREGVASRRLCGLCGGCHMGGGDVACHPSGCCSSVLGWGNGEGDLERFCQSGLSLASLAPVATARSAGAFSFYLPSSPLGHLSLSILSLIVFSRSLSRSIIFFSKPTFFGW
ncbi:MAG: hypothetical protein CEN89_573 [Candidatus Berkelbacteria bacterium Licking1014_7]|uniref:Uncharacterized protein n=1 Tax=Candidatus Berkelbacteria bacterium Licking1014_7 TaxID=2017147 RepID=A0A554LIE7_9BACT|nr:MAG: hypothetical protein CEN89_573 [Candidatus Berkelbacteria bacterium Licking1014_7]